MNEAALAAQAVSPWLQQAERLDEWLRSGLPPEAQANGSHPAWRAAKLARDVLASIARQEEAIKAETPGVPPSSAQRARRRKAGPAAVDAINQLWQGQQGQQGQQGRDSRPTGINQVRQRRDAVLRLGVWAALGAMHEQATAAGRRSNAFVDLIAAISRYDGEVPPGLGPTLGYANNPVAVGFFNDHLRNALHKLSALYDAEGADFNALASSERFDPNGVAMQRWSWVWTLAVTAVYADWLRWRGEGDVEAARQGLWQTADKAASVRFKAPAGLAVLPTRERSIHIDLWTNLVLAQVLAHDPQRWQGPAVSGSWHRVKLAMHDLGERDFREGSDGTRTVFRGLGVEMIYQAVFIDHITARLNKPGGLEHTMARAESSEWQPTIEIALPPQCAGQQPNIRIVLVWQSETGDKAATSSSPRFAAAPHQLVLDAGQRQVMAAWAKRRVGGPEAPASQAQPSRLDHAQLGWRSATDADRFADESGQALAALGHLRLWGAIRPQLEWLDLVLIVQARGRWHRLAPHSVDALQDGESRTWLLLDADELDAADLDVRQLRLALCDPAAHLWVCRYAGLGAFVMLAVDLARLGLASKAETAIAHP